MFFNKKKIEYPKDRGLYAFTKYRRGDFLLYISETKPGVFEFMQLPDRYVLYFSIEEFMEGVSSKLLDFVEQVPTDVFEVAELNKIFLEKNT